MGLLLLTDRQALWPVWLTADLFSVLAISMARVLLRPIKGMITAALLRLATRGQDHAHHPDREAAPGQRQAREQAQDGKEDDDD